MKIQLSFIFSLLFLLNTAKAQDSIAESPKDTIHSVRKATMLSLIVPGAGQIYNHKAKEKGKKNAFWKVPLIYAGLGGVGYLLVTSQSEVIALRKEYRLREAAKNQVPINPEYSQFNNSGLLSLESQSASRRDLSILGLILIYGFQIADAAVEAHFVNFDISEDLSLHFSPWTAQNNAIGLQLRLNFR